MTLCRRFSPVQADEQTPSEGKVMDDKERVRIQNEALRQHRTSSASRNRFWAGLNRYLGAEAEHEHKAAEKEREAPAGRPPKKD
jgi:hypothetical protein